MEEEAACQARWPVSIRVGLEQGVDPLAAPGPLPCLGVAPGVEFGVCLWPCSAAPRPERVAVGPSSCLGSQGTARRVKPRWLGPESQQKNTAPALSWENQPA